jgi:hypothetical protein
MSLATTSRHHQSGISYIESLIAVLLVAITLVPMMDAMRGATTSAGAHEDAAVRHAHVQAKMEAVLAEPYSFLEIAATDAGDLATPSSYSDQVGATNRRLVFLSFYDGDDVDNDNDGFTGMDPDLMWVRTEIEGTSVAVETLLYQ